MLQLQLHARTGPCFSWVQGCITTRRFLWGRERGEKGFRSAFLTYLLYVDSLPCSCLSPAAFAELGGYKSCIPLPSGAQGIRRKPGSGAG